MPPTIVLVAVPLVAGLFAWSIANGRSKARAQRAALEQLGFQPCPQERDHIQETIARLENNGEYRYTVREPRRLASDPRVYYYVKVRDRGTDAPAVAEEEILFPLRRPSEAGLVLIVKPTSLPSGPAVHILGALASGRWDAQPDDLQRLELPLDLRQTNLVGALAPKGATLYDLIDSRTLAVVQSLGDAGGMFVRFRGDVCTVASAHRQIPFQVADLVSRVRPLL